MFNLIQFKPSKFIAGNIKFAECQLSEGISLHLCNLIILAEIIILGERHKFITTVQKHNNSYF